MDVVFYISRYYSQKSKVTYLSEITEALKSLGGKGHLNDICRVMKERGKLQSILTNPAWTNAASREIQSHSTDAQSYVEGNDDLFYSVEGIGSGVWGLRNYQPDQEEQWWPTEEEYTPGLTTEKWLALLGDREVFFDSSLAIVKRFKDYGGAATCTEFAVKYGENKNYYLSGSTYYKTPRGCHPRSLNSNGGWAITAGTSLMNTRLFTYAGEIDSAVLMIHGDKAHSCYMSRDAFKLLRGDNKELLIIPGAVHTDLYDRKDIIPFDKIQRFFEENLK